MKIKSGGVDAGLTHDEVKVAIRIYLKSHHNLEVKTESIDLLYGGDVLDDVTCDFTGGMPAERIKRPRKKTAEVAAPAAPPAAAAPAPKPTPAPEATPKPKTK